MRRCRLAVCAALAVAAVAASVLPFAQVASADSGDITIVSVSSPNSGSGALSVVVNSAAPLTSLTVHFARPGGTEALQVSDFNLPGSSFSAGRNTTYPVQTPLTSMGTPASVVGPSNYLPPGTYTVTVDAATSPADSVARVTPQSGAQFPFLIQQTVRLNPATVDYDHQIVTFTGQVTGVWPGTTATLPMQQEAVQMSGPFGSLSPPTGRTDTSGDFTISAPAAEVGQKYQASVAATSQATSDTSSPAIVVTQTADRVHLSARLGRRTIKYGQTDTIGGTVSYEAAGGPAFQSLPGTTVTLSAPGHRRITAVTKHDGSFVATLPAQHASLVWTVSAGGTPLLEVAAQPLRLNVQLPTAFRKVSLSLGAFRTLSIRTCLNVTSPRGARDVIIAPVTLQYARRPRGPWRKLDAIPAAENLHGYCAAGTPVWAGNVGVPFPSGYYRLIFRGNPGLQPAVTPAVHRWRYPTRITAFSVTPQQVGSKGTVTISGRLWQKTGSWHPYADHPLVILFQYQGDWYYYQAQPKTNAHGYFSGRFTVYVSAAYIAQYDGDRTDFGSASARVRITIISSAAALPPGGMPGVGQLASRRAPIPPR